MATRAQAQKAIEQHEDELSTYANVVGIGTRGEDDDAAIALYVSERPAVGATLPAYMELTEADGTSRIEVTVEEVGPMTPEGGSDEVFTTE